MVASRVPRCCSRVESRGKGRRARHLVPLPRDPPFRPDRGSRSRLLLACRSGPLESRLGRCQCRLCAAKPPQFSFNSSVMTTPSRWCLYLLSWSEVKPAQTCHSSRVGPHSVVRTGPRCCGSSSARTARGWSGCALPFLSPRHGALAGLSSDRCCELYSSAATEQNTHQKLKSQITCSF